jgi:hypothetical protein
MVRAGSLLSVLVFLLAACDSTGPATSIGRLPDGVSNDTTTVLPPVAPDTLPGDTVPGVDTLPPPSDPDSVGPPPDTTGPVLPPYTPKHAGIPFGPGQMPAASFSREFNGTIVPGIPSEMLATLEAARRNDLRLFIQFSGSSEFNRDGSGFSFEIWKKRIDRFRSLDLAPYIADGTLVSHRLMDEPDDQADWNGKLVTAAEVDAMAKYSKEIWPNLPTSIRVVPAFFKGYQFKYLDAVWAQYHIRYAPLDKYLIENVQGARAAGLALVAGINLLDGGSGESGIPGRKPGKLWAMSAAEIRAWGSAVIAEPSICAFLMFEHRKDYLARPDIKAALAELKDKAEKHPGPACRRT